MRKSAFDGSRRLFDFGHLEPSPRTVADVEHFNLFLPFQHAVYRTIYVRLVSVQQMSQLVTLGRQRAAGERDGHEPRP